MLAEFYSYVQVRAEHTWLHWNMRDSNYGFQAIAHRYRVLGGTPYELHESRLVDLAHLLSTIYGSDYIGHPRLEQLVKRNGLTATSFLSGKEEAAAFDNHEYVRLHQSTLRKVEILATLATRAALGTLRVNHSSRAMYGSYPTALGEWLREHWVVTLAGFVGTVLGLVATLMQWFG